MGMDGGTLNSLGNGGGWTGVVLSLFVHGIGGEQKIALETGLPA